MTILEGPMIELKQMVVDDIKKEIVAFANSEGGMLYIGIADDGAIVGIENVDDLLNDIEDALKKV